MTRQRQILVTVTYNDLGCIIDTKAEPYEEPNLQPTCNQLATDLISRQRVSDLFDAWEAAELDHHIPKILRDRLKAIPSAQPEIIHCKDCYNYPGEHTDCPLIGWGRNENDFCSRPERRTDEQID